MGQVSTRMLRHYDKLGLLVPNHTDLWSNYRYYTLDQLSQLHRIIALKDLGLSLAQIADLLKVDSELTTERLRGMLLLKQAEVEQDIVEEKMRLHRIGFRLNQIEQMGQPSPYEVVVKTVAALSVATISACVPHLQEMDVYCALLTNQVYAELQRLKIRPIQPELILYHTNEYRETEGDIEAAIAVHPRHLAQTPASNVITFRELPAHHLVASLIYEGEFKEMTPAILELLRWVGSNKYVVTGSLREVHLSGPAHPAGPALEGAVTELMVPISPGDVPM